MPRAKRVEYAGAHYHICCRGNNGQDIFENEDGRRLFLATLTESCSQTKARVHAYCLMSNHYHLLLETPEANLVAGMKWLQGTYTQRFNAMFSRRGHLFQGRYKAHPVQTEQGLEYFRMVSTYIHLNPFRAKLAGKGCPQKLEEYTWSSFPAYSNSSTKTPPWLYRQKVLRTWGHFELSAESFQKYKEELYRVMRFENDPDAGRRGEFEKQMKRGWYVGGAEFCAGLRERLTPAGEWVETEGPQRQDLGNAKAEQLLKKALSVLGISEERLKQQKAVDLEKQAVVWLIKMNSTVTLGWIAERLEMGNRVNASRALARFRRQNNDAIEVLKEKMYQCTA